MKLLVPILAAVSMLSIAASSPTLTIPVKVDSYSGTGGATISPDGKTVVYVGAINQLKKVNVDSGAEQPIRLATGENISDPRISPDGKKLLFTESDGETSYYQFRIMIANMDGSGLKQLTPDSRPGPKLWRTYQYCCAKFSPDGSQIALQRGNLYDHTTENDVMVVHPDGTDLRAVTGGDVQGWEPTGKGFYLVHHSWNPHDGDSDSMFLYDFATKKASKMNIDSDDISNLLGRINGGFAVDKQVGWLNMLPITDSAVGKASVLPIPTMLQLSDEQVRGLVNKNSPQDKSPKRSLPKALILNHVSSDTSGKTLLLRYGGGYNGGEVIQVIQN